MKKFYTHNGANQMGPFSIDDLRIMGITKDTPIWHEGLADWTTADKVPALNELWAASHSFSSTYHNVKDGSSVGKKLLILAGTVVLILIGVYIYNQVKHQQYVNAEEDVKARIRNNITSYVTAERSEYQYRPIGGILNLNISVNNNTNYIIDHVKVKVIYIKTSGDIWDTRMVDFNFVNPQSKATIRVPDTHRGTSVSYEIVSIKSSALGLY